MKGKNLPDQKNRWFNGLDFVINHFFGTTEVQFLAILVHTISSGGLIASSVCQ
jgi:hypothetical protein